MYNGEIRVDDKPEVIFKNEKLLRENHLELPLQVQGCTICGSNKREK